MRHRTLITMVAAAASAALLASACGSSADPAVEGRAGAYAAIVGWAAGTMAPKPRGTPLVFVQARGTEGIDLETQAAVVGRLEGRVTVRFIDERSEAVDAKAERDPVRGGGVLLVVPPIPPDPPMEQSVTLYRESTAERSYRVTLTRRDGSWAVTAAVEQPRPP